jgi:hypothetical protein
MRRIRTTGVVCAIMASVGAAFVVSSAEAAGGKSIKCHSFTAPVVNGSYNTYTDIRAEHTSCKTAHKVLVEWEHWTPNHRLEFGFACYGSPEPSRPSSCTLHSAVITFRYKEHPAKSTNPKSPVDQKCPSWDDRAQLTAFSKVRAEHVSCSEARAIEKRFVPALTRGSGPAGKVSVGSFVCQAKLQLQTNRESGPGTCRTTHDHGFTFVATVSGQ